MDGLLSVIGNFILEFVFGTLFAAILFWIGWPIVKVLTLGRYPHGQKCLDETMQANCVRALLSLRWPCHSWPRWANSTPEPHTRST